MDNDSNKNINQNDSLDWDQIMKDKLSDHEPIAPAGAWEAFEDFKTQHQTGWDDQIKEKLNNTTANTPSDWPVFQEKLVAWKKLRREYFGLRIAEVAILLLLLLTFYQADTLLPEDQKGNTQLPLTDQSSDVNSDVDLKTAVLKSGFSKEDEDKNQGQDQVVAISDGSSSITNHQDVVEKKQVVAKATTETKKNTGSSISNIKRNENISRATTGQLDLSNEGESDVSINETIKSNRPSFALGSDLLGKEKTNHLGIQELIPLKSGMNTLTTQPPHLDEVPFKLLNKPWVENSARAPIWLSAYSITGVNRVHRPKVDTFESNTSYELFGGGGLAIDFENGRWLLSSGLEYHRSDIKSGKTLIGGDIQMGFAAVTFDKARIHFVTIPVLAKYSFVKNEKNQWFASAGARLHMSSKVKHYFTTVWLPGSFSEDGLDEMALHNVNETNFNYLTINLGLGYQRMLTPRLAVFASTNVELFGQNHSLFPSGEKLDALRMHFGVKHSL